jgi:periplasmic protein CpxP/Spy
MLKKSLLVLIAASLISIAAPFMAAQDSQSGGQNGGQNNDQQAPPPSQENGMRHHSFDPAHRTQELTRHLGLTSDQQPKVLAALQSEHSQMESLHQDSSLSQPDRHAKMMEIHKSTNDQIRAVLDPGQQKKWDEMQARHEQQMQNRRGGPPDSDSGQQGPPPQQ